MREWATRKPILRAAAREMRKQPTPAEEALWSLLRDRRMIRLKFRRQVPIGPFIVDFYGSREKLVVELDGPVHEEPLQAAHDQNRDFYLRSLGLRVLRFTNDPPARAKPRWPPAP
ncbi:MAG: type restriction enzyme protein [Acidobacteriota bacterium]|jgi:very-short-patch-repair endonuclease|nr:type restriction enzyme protein [Acidobacteriota bacterium]